MKKKICFIVATPHSARAFLSNHIRKLSPHYDISLVANFKNADCSVFEELPLKELKDIRIMRGISPFKDLMALIHCTRYLKGNKFNAVHSLTPKAGLIGMFAARIAGIKMRIHIFTGQVWHTRKGLFKKLLIIFDRFIIWNATKILVDGIAQRKFLIDKGILNAENSEVLGNGSVGGVNPTRFHPNAKTKQVIRAELGIDKNEIVFGFLGRLNKDKGVLDLANAFNRICEKFDTARLLLIGKDEESLGPVIEAIITSPGSVILYGRTSQPEILLQAMDIFCLPSYREGFATSVLEAATLEIPVICSDTYGLIGSMIENKSGLRHGVGDVNSLYLQMEKFALNKAMRKAFGKAGRNFVLKNYSESFLASQWLEFYKSHV